MGSLASAMGEAYCHGVMEGYQHGGVIQALRGKILRKPRKQKWMLKTDHDKKTEDVTFEEDDDFEYTCEPDATKWTPLNSNLQMQGIKVLVDKPVPLETIKKIDSTEATLLLLGMMKEKKQKEEKQKKDERIREMALEQKRKKQEK